MRAIAEVGSVYLRCRRREELRLFPRKGGCLRDVKPIITKGISYLEFRYGKEKRLFPKLAVGKRIERFGRPLSPLRRGVGFSMLP